MGILTIPCPGRLSDGSSCPHRFWRVLPLPGACPRCAHPTSPGACSKCGRPLGFGAKVCTECQTPAPPASFVDVVWSLPDGIVARRIDITLKRGDNRRFLIPAGVSALTLIDGRPRVVPGSSIDYWTVLRATAAASEIDAESLRAQAERRGGAPEPVLNVVLVCPGPYPLMLEFSGLRCADGIEVQAQVRAELTVGSIQRLLGRFLSGTNSVLALERIEREVAAELQAAISAAVSGLGVRDLMESQACKRLLDSVQGPFSRAVAGMGFEASSIGVIRIEAPVAEDVLKARGAAALEQAEVATLRMRIDSDVSRQEALLEHATAIETIEQKRKAVVQQALTREADGEVHAMDQRERVAQRVRAVEQALRIEQVISDADLRDLEASRGDESRLRQTLRAIGLRAHLREQEIAEIAHQILRDSMLAKQRRTDQVGDVQVEAEVEAVRRGIRTENAIAGIQIQAAHDAHKASQDDAAARRKREQEDADHARATELKQMENDHQHRMLQLKTTMTEGQLAIIERISPELATALRPRSAVDGSSTQSLETMRQVSEAKLAALREAAERADQSHRESLRAIVDAVERARAGGGPTTTVNVGGRNPSRD